MSSKVITISRSNLKSLIGNLEKKAVVTIIQEGQIAETVILMSAPAIVQYAERTQLPFSQIALLAKERSYRHRDRNAHSAELAIKSRVSALSKNLSDLITHITLVEKAALKH